MYYETNFSYQNILAFLPELMGQHRQKLHLLPKKIQGK